MQLDYIHTKDTTYTTPNRNTSLISQGQKFPKAFSFSASVPKTETHF